MANGHTVHLHPVVSAEAACTGPPLVIACALWNAEKNSVDDLVVVGVELRVIYGAVHSLYDLGGEVRLIDVALIAGLVLLAGIPVRLAAEVHFSL